MLRILTISLASLLLATPSGAEGGDLDASLSRVMKRWATIKYETPADEQADRFGELAEEAAKLTKRYPDRAEPRVWEAIVRASYAGAMGGIRSLFSALPQVKRARDLLLEAEKIDPEVLNGSVYTSLGSLYYQVPGSPVGFGDEKLALQYLEKAVSLSPDGIDSNFFMGDYWRTQGDAVKAREYLERALQAPPRPHRELADAGRRREIESALRELGS